MTGRRITVAAAGGMAALLSVVAWSLWHARRIEGEAVPAPAVARMQPAVARAVTAARERVEHEPGSAAAWGRLAAVLDAHELSADAARCYRHAAALDPGEFRWAYLLALAGDASGQDWSSTAATLAHAGELRPDYPPLLLHQARLHLEHGDGAAAVATLQHARRVAPHSAAVLRALGQALLSRGATGQAVDALHEAAAVSGGDRAVWSALAQALSRLGDTDGAAEAARHAASAPPPRDEPDPVRAEVEALGMSPQHCLDRAPKLFAAGQWDAVVDNLTVVARADPRHPKVQMQIGLAHARAGRAPEAIAALQRAVELDPTLLQAHTELAALLTTGGRFDLAIPQWRAAHALDPGEPDILTWLGTAQALSQDFTAAIATFRQVIELSPDDANAHYNLGAALLNRGEVEAAARQFERALELAPDHVEAKAKLATARRRMIRSRGR